MPPRLGYGARVYRNGYIKRLEDLGFSDHVPYPFPNGYESNYRVPLSMLDDYFITLNALRDEYRDDIEIRIGFEAEYYPKYFQNLLDLIVPFGCEYLILGQHFIHNEIDSGAYNGSPTDSNDRITIYVDQVIEALKTGMFTYVAHPDIIPFTGDGDFYIKEMTRLCKAARELNVPLEINGLGMESHRAYPSDRFFKIAGEVGNRVIIGCDAHRPDAVANADVYKDCKALADEYSLHLLDVVTLAPLKN